jgi:glycosyltransferase involved in cell wall biosynthesis
LNKRIVYVQYTNPAAYPPLEHSSHALADAGWEVAFLGVTKVGEPQLRWPPRSGIAVHELPPGPAGWLRKVHYMWFAIWVLAWIARLRPAYVYASDTLACPVVLPLSYWKRIKVIYHEHDAPQVARHGLVRRLVLLMRRQLAARAEARVLPNDQRVQDFVRSVGDHRTTFSVWNCPIRAEVGPARESHRGDGLRLVYVGSIVPERLPVTLIESLALMPDDVQLRVIGYEAPGHPGYVRQLLERAGRLGVADRIEVLDALPHPQMLKASRDTDVGLVLMKAAAEQWMPGASNKPFDYLAGGLALLVHDQAGWRELLLDPGYGIACDVDDVHSIASAVLWLLDHPVEMRAMGERGRQRVLSDWNYETQFAPVQQLLAR